MLQHLLLKSIRQITKNLVKMLLAVEMAGIMVPSAKMVISHCTVQFFWLIFQVCLCFTLGTDCALSYIFCLSSSARMEIYY